MSTYSLCECEWSIHFVKKCRTDIIMKPEDKGSATVVTDRDWYLNECYRQLGDTTFYEKAKKDWTYKVHIQVKCYHDGVLQDDLIDEKTYDY